MDKKEFWAMVFLIIILGTVFAINTIERQMTACTADAMICPDGTAVGRVGPACEFAPCPDPFTTCVSEGNPVLESYPRQCRFPDGTMVTETLS